jgi:hypothetical protein
MKIKVGSFANTEQKTLNIKMFLILVRRNYIYEVLVISWRELFTCEEHNL